MGVILKTLVVLSVVRILAFITKEEERRNKKEGRERRNIKGRREREKKEEIKKKGERERREEVTVGNKNYDSVVCH